MKQTTNNQNILNTSPTQNQSAENIKLNGDQNENTKKSLKEEPQDKVKSSFKKVLPRLLSTSKEVNRITKIERDVSEHFGTSLSLHSPLSLRNNSSYRLPTSYNSSGTNLT